MKSITLILFGLTILNFSCLGQELKSLKANKEKDSDYFEYENYTDPNHPIGNSEFLPGCSWYCGSTVDTIYASSELAGNGSITYNARNAHDFNKNTAWIEGSSNYGVGEWIEDSFNFESKKGYNGKLGITRLLIANGYKKSKEIWKANSRIKKLKMYLNGFPYGILELDDYYEIQTIDIEKIMFLKGETTKIRFEIVEVYKGEKYSDTALSLLMFEGVGVH